MKTTKNLVFVIICMFMFSCLYSCGWGSKKQEQTINNTENTKTSDQHTTGNSGMDANAQQNLQQDQQQTQIPVTGNASGQSSTISATTGIDLKTMGKNFIFANGEGGFNIRVKSDELVPTMVGDAGITTDGKHFMRTELVNACRPVNAPVVKYIGTSAINEKGQWTRQDMVEENGYTYYKGTVAYNSLGYALFTLEFMTQKGGTTRRFAAHELVKRDYPFSEEVM